MVATKEKMILRFSNASGNGKPSNNIVLLTSLSFFPGIFYPYNGYLDIPECGELMDLLLALFGWNQHLH